MSNHWRPSPLATREPADQQPGYDTLRPHNISRRSVGSGIDKHIYSTEAEHPHAVAPFIANGMQVDYQRDLQGRTYLIRQGGDTLYHRPDPVAQGLSYNAEDMPIPSPHREFQGPTTQNQTAEEGLKYGARRVRDTVRGKSTRDYFGHDQVLNTHTGRWHDAGGKGR